MVQANLKGRIPASVAVRRSSQPLNTSATNAGHTLSGVRERKSCGLSGSLRETSKIVKSGLSPV